jgi:hypothetical protein
VLRHLNVVSLSEELSSQIAALHDFRAGSETEVPECPCFAWFTSQFLRAFQVTLRLSVLIGIRALCDAHAAAGGDALTPADICRFLWIQGERQETRGTMILHKSSSSTVYWKQCHFLVSVSWEAQRCIVFFEEPLFIDKEEYDRISKNTTLRLKFYYTK